MSGVNTEENRSNQEDDGGENKESIGNYSDRRDSEVIKTSDVNGERLGVTPNPNRRKSSVSKNDILPGDGSENPASSRNSDPKRPSLTEDTRKALQASRKGSVIETKQTGQNESKQPSAMNANKEELDPEKKRLYGIKLLNIMRTKINKDDALLLIEAGAKLDEKDQAGWQALHFASLNGSVDLINALVKKGAHPNCYDNNYQTPLHKAARRGQVDAVIALVAHGAMLETKDWEGNVALELAVVGKHVKVVETLFMFGAEPSLIDWSWTMKDKTLFTKEEKDILVLFNEQLHLAPGLRYGGILLDVAYVQPGVPHKFKSFKASMFVRDARTPFFVYCCKMHSEYADLKSHLKERQSPFSDMYECKTWGLSRNVVSFTITVEGVPSSNEMVDLVSPQGKIGRIENIDKREKKNKTVFTMSLKLAKGTTRFALALRTEPEKFQVTKEAQTIQPKNEPDAAIDIPEGTFKEAAELQVNVVETKDVNEDEEAGPILLTNVIDMSMSDGQQPEKDIEMKLPIHMKQGDDPNDMCVLATSKEDPEDTEDWEVIDARPDRRGKAAIFKISHFSIYAGASKSKVQEDKKNVVEAITRSLNKTRKIEISVYVKEDPKQRGFFELVVEVTSPKKTENRQKHWKKSGYQLQEPEESQKYEVGDNQTFRLTFSGKIASTGNEEASFLDYESKKKSKSLAFDMKVKNLDADTMDVTGSVKVEQEIVIEKEVQKEEPDGCMRIKIVTEVIRTTTYETMVTIPVGLAIPKEEVLPDLKEELERARTAIRRPSKGPESEYPILRSNSFFLDMDKECTIPALEGKVLMNIADNLTLDEAKNLGTQLRIGRENIDTITKECNSSTEVGFEVLRRYRGKRPHWSQIGTIVKALLQINRLDLARHIAGDETPAETEMETANVEFHQTSEDVEDTTEVFEGDRAPSPSDVIGDVNDTNEPIGDDELKDE